MRVAAIVVGLLVIPSLGAAQPHAEIQHYGAWTIATQVAQLDHHVTVVATTPAEEREGVGLFVTCSRVNQAVGVVFPYAVATGRLRARWSFNSGAVHEGHVVAMAQGRTVALTAGVDPFITELQRSQRLVMEIDGVEFAFDLTGADGAVGSANAICDLGP